MAEHWSLSISKNRSIVVVVVVVALASDSVNITCDTTPATNKTWRFWLSHIRRRLNSNSHARNATIYTFRGYTIFLSLRFIFNLCSSEWLKPSHMSTRHSADSLTTSSSDRPPHTRNHTVPVEQNEFRTLIFWSPAWLPGLNLACISYQLPKVIPDADNWRSTMWQHALSPH